MSNISSDLQLVLHSETSTTEIPYNLKIQFFHFAVDGSVQLDGIDDVMHVWLPLMLICVNWNDFIELAEQFDTRTKYQNDFWRRVCVSVDMLQIVGRVKSSQNFIHHVLRVQQPPLHRSASAAYSSLCDVNYANETLAPFIFYIILIHYDFRVKFFNEI